jgi:hypothetical protein
MIRKPLSLKFLRNTEIEWYGGTHANMGETIYVKEFNKWKNKREVAWQTEIQSLE